LPKCGNTGHTSCAGTEGNANDPAFSNTNVAIAVGLTVAVPGGFLARAAIEEAVLRVAIAVNVRTAALTGAVEEFGHTFAEAFDKTEGGFSYRVATATAVALRSEAARALRVVRLAVEINRSASRYGK
jgi:hypothetical protein